MGTCRDVKDSAFRTFEFENLGQHMVSPYTHICADP